MNKHYRKYTLKNNTGTNKHVQEQYYDIEQESHI